MLCIRFGAAVPAAIRLGRVCTMDFQNALRAAQGCHAGSLSLPGISRGPMLAAVGQSSLKPAQPLHQFVASQVIPLEERGLGLGEAFNMRLDELKVVDIAFLGERNGGYDCNKLSNAGMCPARSVDKRNVVNIAFLNECAACCVMLSGWCGGCEHARCEGWEALLNKSLSAVWLGA